MTALHPPPPVDVRPLLRPLGDELLALLRSLDAAAWERAATARWSVRDVAAHLFDTALRRLTFHRDGAPMPAPDRPLLGYGDLVGFLHRLNADWIAASARLGPRVLVDLLAVVDPQEAEFLAGLDPDGPAFFPVAWAGEDASRNWLDVAREYTERWHHQQQIRDAVAAPPLTAPRWLRPVLATAVRCLPPAWAAVAAVEGTTVQVEVRGEAGGAWVLRRAPGGWELLEGPAAAADATVATDEETAWRLWHRMIAPAEAARRIEGRGPETLVAPFLDSVALMA